MVYFEILFKIMPVMLTIQRRNCHQYSESGTLNNFNSGTIIYATNLLFMW